MRFRINKCNLQSESCLLFKDIDDLIISIVNEHYFDLQMYANFVFDIDNNAESLSKKNNIYVKIMTTIKDYNIKYPFTKLFTKDNMSLLNDKIAKIMTITKKNWISSKDYMTRVNDIEFFGSGAASTSILLKIKKDNIHTPLIVKIVPLELPHHYQKIPSIRKSTDNLFIKEYIEIPSYALFIKEAWMYCFTKNYLEKYTPTFNCIGNCYFIDGLPINNLNNLREIYSSFIKNKISKDRHVSHKKWLNILLDSNPDNNNLRNKIVSSKYGCFEMKEIEHTLGDLLKYRNAFNLGMIFEYFYTKIVASFIGRIIFTDDHFGNVAYISVDYTRCYNVVCNDRQYTFYIPPGKMIQFIDLERYIFNFSNENVFTNVALKSIYTKKMKYYNNNPDTKVSKLIKNYMNNNFIYDKSISLLMSKHIGKRNFKDPTEYDLMLDIISNPLTYDIKSFFHLMNNVLPIIYLTKPMSDNIVEYYLDLDDDSTPVISLSQIISDN